MAIFSAVKTKLKVISAIIDKALSPDILVRYNSIMDSIKDCFEMDVPYDDISGARAPSAFR